MEKRTLFLAGIPIAGALAVANLLFFWLAPDVDCKMIVYGFGLGTILLQGIASALLLIKCGVQKSMPMLVSGTAFALAVLVAGGVMLALAAPFRTALYFLIVFSVLYVSCAGFLACMAADDLWAGVENAVAEPRAVRHPVREWLRSFAAAFSRRLPGETDAERHVRNNREVRPESVQEPAPAPSEPPPLPVRQT